MTQIEENTWRVCFMHYELGLLDTLTRRILPTSGSKGRGQ